MSKSQRAPAGEALPESRSEPPSVALPPSLLRYRPTVDLDPVSIHAARKRIDDLAASLSATWRSPAAEDRRLVLEQLLGRDPDARLALGDLVALAGPPDQGLMVVGVRMLRDPKLGLSVDVGAVDRRLADGWIYFRDRPGPTVREALEVAEVPRLVLALRAHEPMDTELPWQAQPEVRRHVTRSAQAAEDALAGAREVVRLTAASAAGMRGARRPMISTQGMPTSAAEDLAKVARGWLRSDRASSWRGNFGSQLQALVYHLERQADEILGVVSRDPITSAEVASAASGAMIELAALDADNGRLESQEASRAPTPAEWRGAEPRRRMWVPLAMELVRRGWSAARLADLVAEDCWAVDPCPQIRRALAADTDEITKLEARIARELTPYRQRAGRLRTQRRSAHNPASAKPK